MSLVKRRRVSGDTTDYVLVWRIDQNWQFMPQRQRWGRMYELVILSYRISKEFTTRPQFLTWYTNTPQVAESIETIKDSLIDPAPVVPQDYAPVAAAFQLVGSTLAPFTHANPIIDYDTNDVDLGEGIQASFLSYVAHKDTPNEVEHIKILFRNAPVEWIRNAIDAWNHQTIDFSSRAMVANFRYGLDYLCNHYARAVAARGNPYHAVAATMEAYNPNVNIAGNYWGNLIVVYTPAKYFLLGFGVVGAGIMERIAYAQGVHVANAGTLVLNAAFIANIQSACIPWNPFQPLGPGGFSWLCIGVLDRLVTEVQPGSTGQFTNLQQVSLDISIVRATGTTANINVPIISGAIHTNTIQSLQARANAIFTFANVVFNGHAQDFYKPEIRSDWANQVTQITFTVNGLVRERFGIVGKGIDGNNIYWENLLVPGDYKWKGFRGNFVLFKSRDEEHNVYLHGCVQRALACDCKYNVEDRVVFCSCPLPGKLETLSLEDTLSLCKAMGDKWIVIVIEISKLDKNKHTQKKIVLAHVGKNYYSDPDGKVLYISCPMWEKSTAHCALWLPKPWEGKTREAEYAVFLSKSMFNRVNANICPNYEDYICPICGDRYNKKNMWGHYIRHSDKKCCISCGLRFDTQEDLDLHMKFHCKNLPLESTIVLADDPIVFKDPENTDLWICVYADLESAILPGEGDDDSRLHKNILVGWVDDYVKEVRVAREIKEFFNALVRLPATDLLIYFHNGEGYDFHFIVRDLCSSRKGFVKDFSVIGDSGQKIKYFSVKYRNKNFHFRDSYAFVSESLENWIASSLKSGCEFPCFKSTFDEYKREILLRKNPFPYNAILSEKDLDRPINELIAWAKCDIAEELFCYKYTKEELLEFADWLMEHYQKCEWHKVLDYYVDYLKCDVSQLKDVMDFFVQNVRTEFKVNVHDYYGTPSLTWAVWLSRNKIPLDPIENAKHYDVINSTIRGGQTGVFTRRFEESVDGGKLFDLDCNSLYATVMLKFSYPCHDWREEAIPYPADLLDFIKRLHSSGRSAFVELDMKVKENSFFYDYIPIASKRKVHGVYNYQAMRFYDTEDPHLMYFEGLTQVVGEHPHYCCHSRNLEWYIEHDVIEISHVWFILSGKDEFVFKDYVQHNLDRRRDCADDPIKKMIYKLLNNSLYGKTYEDETHRVDYYIERKENLDVNDRFKVRRVITEMDEWVLYEGVKNVFMVKRPVYLGACITEFSKLWMYSFYYDKIKKVYPDSRVFYTDTDALTIWFPTKVKELMDVAWDLNTEDEQIIDTSNFDVIPVDEIHKKHNNEPGLFKSETGNHAIVKFIGLRAKTYIMVCDDGSIKMSVKGCPMKEKEKLKWEDFERVLMNPGEGYSIEFDAIRSKFHMVRSVKLTKIVLSADDRKRYILPDLIHTLPLFCKEHLLSIQE